MEVGFQVIFIKMNPTKIEVFSKLIGVCESMHITKKNNLIGI